MKTAKQRESAFRDGLATLMARHGAELEITDDGFAYGMHTAVVEISMDSQYDNDGNQTAEYVLFRL